MSGKAVPEYSDMPDTKRLVCLANARKLHGRFVAGRAWRASRAGSWIRPVSDREGQEVSEYERQYEDGSDPQVLDIIDVPVLGPRPCDYQTENWLLDPRFYWERVGRLSRLDLNVLIDPITPLWIDGHSTYHGRNDTIPLHLADSLRDSLRLVHVNLLRLVVFRPGEAFGNNKRRVQGRFSHAGKNYRLWVTDPCIERTYLAKLNGTYEIGNSFLTVSLGEPYQGACYKLIAAVLTAS